MRLLILCASSLLALTALTADSPKTGEKQEPPSQLYIATGTLISGSGAPIQVRSLKASIEDGAANNPGGVKQKGDNQKVVSIASGTAFISNNSLAVLLNSKLGERGVRGIKVSNDKGQVNTTGTAKQTVSVPFTIEGPVTLTPQGFIRLDTKTVNMANLPGLADLLGVNPEKMVGNGSVQGVRAQKDTIIFDPDLLWGLPIHGKVTRLGFETNGLLLVFGDGQGLSQRHSNKTAVHRARRQRR